MFEELSDLGAATTQSVREEMGKETMRVRK